MQLSPRVMVAAALLPLVASTASARIGIEQQQADYLFRYFSDSDDVHVWSHFGAYAVDLGPKISIQMNRETVVVPAIGAPAGSPEAVDAITTASRPISNTADAFEDYAKVRNEVQGDIAYGGLTAGYYVSDEEDYYAQQVRASYNRDLFNQNLNVSVGSSYGWDEILPLVDEDTDATPDQKTTKHANLVITQVLTRTSLIRLGGEYTLVEGLQHNPYRNVYAGGTNVPEIHPDDRTRRAVFVKINQYFGNRSSVRVNYRYYEDDWGVVSHTYGVKLNQMIKDGVIARYRYRYYDQSAATFHRDEYETVDGIGGFLSADYRMGRTEAHLFGGRLDFNLGNLPGHSRFLSYLDLTVKYERYFNSSNFSANVFEAGLRARLQ